MPEQSAPRESSGSLSKAYRPGVSATARLAFGNGRGKLTSAYRRRGTSTCPGPTRAGPGRRCGLSKKPSLRRRTPRPACPGATSARRPGRGPPFPTQETVFVKPFTASRDRSEQIFLHLPVVVQRLPQTSSQHRFFLLFERRRWRRGHLALCRRRWVVDCAGRSGKSNSSFGVGRPARCPTRGDASSGIACG